MKIYKIKLSELAEFIKSDKYKMLPIVPITEARAMSYINNPRANKNSYIAYLAFIDATLVGFRTILPDKIFENGKELYFGWCSGNWVNPKFRKQGISNTLFNEVYKDWDGMLAYTNVAPISKIIFDKSNKFTNNLDKKGVRIYQKPIIYELLKDRSAFVKHIKVFLLFMQNVMLFMLLPYKYLVKLIWKNKIKSIQIENELNDEIKYFLNQNPQSVFMRKSNDYKWIFDFPWITKNSEHISYPFSYKYNKLEILFVTTNNDKGKINGLAILKNYDSKVSVPYFYSKSTSKKLAKGIIAWITSNNINYATFYNEQLIQELKKMFCTSIFRKKIILYTDISKKISERINLQNAFRQDGDGDNIFT